MNYNKKLKYARKWISKIQRKYDIPNSENNEGIVTFETFYILDPYPITREEFRDIIQSIGEERLAIQLYERVGTWDIRINSYIYLWAISIILAMAAFIYFIL